MDVPSLSNSPPAGESSGHIIIADDDPSILLLLRHILSENNFDVTEARSGMEAIELCREQQFDLAIFDLVMPNVDGISACKEVTFQTQNPPPVLIVTSLDDDTSISHAFDAGAIDYITKPINWSVFKQRVKRIVEAEKNRQKIQRLEFHDTLTGLPNRTLLLDRLESATLRAQRNKNMVALMMIDIDNLKLINETLGHANGDKLIQSVASRLSKTIRNTDTLSRSGGDEFDLIIENIHRLEDIGLMAEKFSRTIEHNLTLMDEEIHVKASIGISVYPQDGNDIGSLLSHADAALYRAKDRGGNVYEFYSPELGKNANRRLKLENALRQAIVNDELVVYYQPKINLNNNQASGIEALVRWNHPEQGIIPPDEFIPVAEETGLIIELGYQVIEKACAQFKKWQSDSIPVNNISINVSARQFREQDLVSILQAALDRHQLDATHIELELTESTLLKNEDQAEVKLNQLHDMGIKISIDDFGTGYASLAYLKRLPIDILKIDRSFTDGIVHDPDDIAIVNAIYGLATGLGLKLVAEGIETAEQLQRIKALGVDYGQGYYWSPPLPAEQYTEMLKNLKKTA
ncbi:diguanylate cyclase/phosphodiesterase (GGDEF & EAL domains) with PAS/PAC sensor(s) [hydrothermal vent metagenome]|uniref:Diguanylate cyclase/phosphodiesterase (GGDEF & EAL domains) with PAS/PAC sensor(S) n=1 Tax=hydrothermal vent metagenome TaxID=652676 RepID=A0A3B0Y3A5_9ZZZZ